MIKLDTQEKIEIYKGILSTYENIKSANELSKQYNLHFFIGICNHLAYSCEALIEQAHGVDYNVTEINYSFLAENFSEFFSRKPDNVITASFWWPRTAKGLQKRIQVLTEIIKELES